MNKKNELVIFTTQDGEVKLDVNMAEETVWLTQSQMAVLFDREISTVSRHISNVFKEEVEKESNLRFLQIANSDRPVAIYSLDVIISVGYRVKSQRGVEFRRWANSVLKEYILRGYAVNDTRLKQLNQLVQLIKRTGDDLDGKQILSVIENYSTALDMLDDYDHQVLRRPKGRKTTYVVTYEECREVIDKMRFNSDSELFGNEKDDSFKGSIGAIYQSFGGKDVYPSLEEKAANLLYFVTKNHSFSDGNKRIAATMFLYFLDMNDSLYSVGEKVIDDYTLVALTIMIAESRPEEKEMMINVVMNCIR
ncbi:MAG: virulence protein RhuM/Fic/DOC family protein [Prevotellaceae bacterium]|nr:virulence protein RhuM/Fic/DOC family protein [Candidatus Faecinaster equi]